MKNLFNPGSLSNQHRTLASHFPIGRLWTNIYNTSDDIGKFVIAMAVEHYRFQILCSEVYKDFDIRQTVQFIEDWEKSVGIPDELFSTDVPIERRRLQAEQKFTNFGGVQRDEDFVRVASLFGYSIRRVSTSASGFFPLEFPIIFSESRKSASHTMTYRLINDTSSGLEFPLAFPLEFASGGQTLLNNIFETLAPANVQVIIQRI